LDEWELYDLQADPEETKNFIHDPAYAKIVEELKAELRRLQEQLKVPPPDQTPPYAYGPVPKPKAKKQ
jgi:hypothetical protein